MKLSMETLKNVPEIAAFIAKFSRAHQEDRFAARVDLLGQREDLMVSLSELQKTESSLINEAKAAAKRIAEINRKLVDIAFAIQGKRAAVVSVERSLRPLGGDEALTCQRRIDGHIHNMRLSLQRTLERKQYVEAGGWGATGELTSLRQRAHDLEKSIAELEEASREAGSLYDARVSPIEVKERAVHLLFDAGLGADSIIPLDQGG